jgi:hypothetical protein
MTDIITRLLRACATGYGCRALISPKGLRYLTDNKLWREAAEAILRLDAIHPRSQECFLSAWAHCSFGYHLDDDLAVAFLRKVMPPYLGFDAVLFRGQSPGPVGMSWSTSAHCALMYALYGFASPIEAECRTDGLILYAIVPEARIIAAPGLFERSFHARTVGEHIIDPNGLEFLTEPALDAAVWIEERTADRRRRLNLPGCNAPQTLESLGYHHSALQFYRIHGLR